MRNVTLRISSLPNPKAGRRVFKLQRRAVCMTALETGIPMVTAMALDRYMKEMAGAMCAASTTAWREMNTALWAMPVPKPLGKM